jgi:hypothetical protein
VEARGVIQKGALNIKNDARKNVAESAPTRNAHAQYAITYETHMGGATLSPRAEIGYDKDKPGGALGNLLEFGGGKDHSPPHRDLGRALEAEEPRFEAAISTIASRLL